MYYLDMIFENAIHINTLAIEFKMNFRWHYTNMAAPFWRFYWNSRGTAQIFMEREEHSEFTVIEHQGYLIPPETPFSVKSEGLIDHFYIHFTLGHAMVLSKKGLFPLRDSSIFAAYIQSIISERTKIQIDSPQYKSLTVMASGVELIAIALLPDQYLSTGIQDPFLRRALEYINQNTRLCLTSSMIAEAAGCAERSLRRKFLEYLNITPIAYSIKRRIEYACIFLHFSNETIEEIADKTGFYDRYHFSKTFTLQRGMSPVTFRKISKMQDQAIPCQEND